MTPKSKTLKAWHELYAALCQARCVRGRSLVAVRGGLDLLIREAGGEIDRLTRARGLAAKRRSGGCISQH